MCDNAYKFIILLCSLSFGLPIVSAQYVDQIIQTDFGIPTISRIYKVDDSFIISGIYYNDNDNLGSILMQVDNNIDISYFTFGQFAFANSPLLFHENGVTCLAKNRNLQKGVLTANFSQDFLLNDTMHVQTPGHYNFPGAPSMVEDHIYSTIVFDEGENKKFGFAKFDRFGNQIWFKRIEQNLKYGYPWFSEVSDDQHLLISYTLLYQGDVGADPVVAKIDTSGSIIWKTPPIEFLDGGAAPVYFDELHDGKIILSFRKNLRLGDGDPNYDWLNDYPYPPTYMLLDQEGNLLAEYLQYLKMFDITRVRGVKAGKGDYFFSYGFREKQASGLPDEEYGFITKYSTQGDTIWSKLYRHHLYNRADIYHVIQDIYEHDNGDITVLGSIDPDDDDPNQIWFFKLNNDGCFSENQCDDGVEVLTSTLETIAPQSPISLYPNPTHDFIYFNNPEDLKLDFIELYDIEGQLIQKWTQQLEYINISHLPNSYYTIKIGTGNISYLQKIVKS